MCGISQCEAVDSWLLGSMFLSGVVTWVEGISPS